jgi:hypothetical protein
MADKVIDVEIRTNTTGIKSLRQELRETTIALQQATDPALIERLQQKAGELKDTMADVNATIEATAGSATENLAKGLGKATSVGIAGFQGLISAQALFGDESKAVTETLVKLQALAGLSDALNSLGALGDTMTEIKASFIAAASKLGLLTTAKEVDIVVTEGQIVATEGATVATNVLGKTMNALPIFAIIAGLTAVVGAIAYFASQTEEATITQEDLNETTKATADAFSKAKQNVDEVGLAFANASKGVGSKKKALELYNQKFGDTLGIAKDYNQAEAIFTKNADTYIKVSALRAKADAFRALSAKASADAFVASQEVELKTMDIVELAKTRFLKGDKAAIKEGMQLARNNRIEAQAEANKRIQALDAEANKFATQATQLEGTLVTIKQESEVKKKEIDKISASEKKKNLEDFYNSLVNINAKEVKLYEAKITQIKKIDLAKQALDFEETEKALINRTQVLDRINILQAEFDANEKAIADARIQQIKDNLAIELDAIGANENAKIEAKLKADIEIGKIQKDEATRERELQRSKFQMTSDAFGAISDLLMSFNTNNEKDAKKQFNINKGFALGQAFINTGLAVTGALTAGGNPIKLATGAQFVEAGIAATIGAANIAKIASSKFGGGGSGGGGSMSAPSSSSSTQQPSATPSFNLYGSGGTANNQNASGANGGNGQNITVTAVVSETDMTNTQNRVNSMKSSASL